MTSERVQVSVDQHVAHVRLNRPDKRNGLDLPMFEALAAAGYRLAHESGVRAVVLSGNGSVFCAGLDWGSFLAHGGNASERLLERPDGRRDNLAQRVSRTWADMPVPVIAALHGVAFGGGLQIALGADIRYAHPATQLSRVCEDPLDAALDTARLIAAQAPRAVRTAKRLLDESRGLSVAAALRLETELQRTLLAGSEQMEAVMAVMEKRPAVFEDP